MKFWLLKSEPKEYSWNNMCKDIETHWDGVHNYQAQNNMKEMAGGDVAFFYHSNTDKAIVGIVKISKNYYMHEDHGLVVNVKFHSNIDHILTLKEIKAHPLLKNMLMVKQPRLSVSPVSQEEAELIMELCSTHGLEKIYRIPNQL